jgi:transcriptional regulator with XRE-family HTH domain
MTKSFSQHMSEAARDSGLEDQEIAAQIGVSPGYFSRLMRHTAQQWAKRLVAFMRVTLSLAPAQWIAEQMGCDLVPRDSRAAEVAALKQRLQEIEREGRVAA